MTQIPVRKTDSGAKPKRPLILTIVVLLLLARVIYLGTTMGLLFLFSFASQGSGYSASVTDVLLGIALFGLTLFLLVAVIGLWQLRPAAWALNMLIMGFLLIVGLWIHFTDQAGLVNDAGLLLNILIVFYLVQPDVRALFVPRTVDS